MTQRLLFAACAVALLAGCGQKPTTEKTEAPAASGPITPAQTDLPAGTYKVDPAHTSVTFRVNHIGMSHYTARFTRTDASLQLDPAKPDAAQLDVTVDPKSLETDNADKTYDFDAMLTGPDWLDAAKFPKIAFRSTKIELTGPKTAKITGDFTLHGVTKPLVLETTFNGGYTGHPMDPNARIGFSARGTLKRSDYGVSLGVPKPGSTLGVSDEVEVIVETEFTGPPSKDAVAAAPAAAH